MLDPTLGVTLCRGYQKLRIPTTTTQEQTFTDHAILSDSGSNPLWQPSAVQSPTAPPSYRLVIFRMAVDKYFRNTNRCFFEVGKHSWSFDNILHPGSMPRHILGQFVMKHFDVVICGNAKKEKITVIHIIPKLGRNLGGSQMHVQTPHKAVYNYCFCG